jgi:hypothetical protein
VSVLLGQPHRFEREKSYSASAVKHRDRPSKSRRFVASMVARTISTFSRDIAYSERPADSRASSDTSRSPERVVPLGVRIEVEAAMEAPLHHLGVRHYDLRPRSAFRARSGRRTPACSHHAWRSTFPLVEPEADEEDPDREHRDEHTEDNAAATR